VMTSPTEPMANKNSKVRDLIAPDAAAVAHVLEAFALMPLHMLAEVRNQSIASLLHDVTGLSKARISQGNLDAIRESTRKKIHEHQQKLQEDQIADPDELAYVRHRASIAPKTQSGMYAVLAGWIHQLEVLPEVPLPISKAVSLTIDELLEALLETCRDNDLHNFKQILSCHIKHHGTAVRIGDEPSCAPAKVSDLAELDALENWSQTASFMKRFVDSLYLDVISALDAEWSSHYFSGRQCCPLFPLVMVRPRDGLLEGRVKLPSKNLIFRPSRRLLEFLYALTFYIRHQKWPAQPPSPQTLADILFRPGEQAVLKTAT